MKDDHAEKMLNQLMLSVNEIVDAYFSQIKHRMHLIFRHKIIYAINDFEVIDKIYINNLNLAVEKGIKGEISELLLEISNLFSHPNDFIKKKSKANKNDFVYCDMHETSKETQEKIKNWMAQINANLDSTRVKVKYISSTD